MENIENVEHNQESFEKLFEASISETKEIKEGQIISGTVIKVTNDTVMVDIGYKSEGRVPKEEFLDEKGNMTVAVGDKVDVFLESAEDDEGLVIVSKEKADKLRIWDEIAEACERGDIVEGRVTERVKGGLAVDIGVKAFLPGSQIDLSPIRDLDRLLGNTYQFKIIKFNKLRGNIVLSRRAILEKEREVIRQKTLSVIEEGAVVKGVVKNLTDYGAFVDLGGIDGLLHITDLSWKRINHPNEVLKIGEEIQVKVLKYDTSKERVSLGLKQMISDPWQGVDMKFPRNAKVSGKVVNLTDYGAFIEIEEGIEGLIHVSEMSWTKRVKHPSAVLKIGDEVEAIILDVDMENRRMSLGLKQTQPNPWDELVKKYAPGTKIRGEVKNITDFGIFVEVEEDIDGLVHISDLSWSNKIKNPHDVYKKGDVVETVVLNVDPSAERFALGIKQLNSDPWQEAVDKYSIGSEVEGEVIKVTDFGLFVQVTDEVEGLVHVSEISEEKIDKPSSVHKVGDKIKAIVLSVDPQERKMSLSIKAAKSGLGKKIAEKARKQVEKKPTLGDLMGDELRNLGTKKEVESDPKTEVEAEPNAGLEAQPEAKPEVE
ncbi:MAG: 30S ribosomal protein S1 [Bdellovibrionales bacterium]|nr:30S ribosomal protein S1 [Bdellovibrionales bacterium]